MIIRIILAILLFPGLLAGAAPARSEAPLQVLAEKTPLTFRNRDNLADGQGTELVQALMAKAGFDYQLYFVPWKRAYRRAEIESNTIIYPLARTPERENKFHWIGQITPVHYYLFRASGRNDIEIDQLEDINRYTVGVVNYYVHHVYLQSLGIKNIETVNDNLQNMHKLMRNRIDLFASSSSGVLIRCEQEKINCSNFTPAFKLEGISKGLYIGANIDTDPAVLKRLRTAYTELKSDGSLLRIMNDRMNDPDHDKFLKNF